MSFDTWERHSNGDEIVQISTRRGKAAGSSRGRSPCLRRSPRDERFKGRLPGSGLPGIQVAGALDLYHDLRLARRGVRHNSLIATAGPRVKRRSGR